MARDPVPSLYLKAGARDQGPGTRDQGSGTGDQGPGDKVDADWLGLFQKNNADPENKGLITIDPVNKGLN